MLENAAYYRRRPQLPPKDPEVIAQMLESYSGTYHRVEVRDASGMGRGIFAREHIAKGEVFFFDEPFVAAFVDGDRCQLCFRELTPTPEFPTPPEPVTCEGCGIERYCSEQCCQKAWNSYHRAQCAHAKELKEFVDFFSAGQTSSALLPALLARLAGMTISSDSWPCHTLSLPAMQLLSPGCNDGEVDASHFCITHRRMMTALGLEHHPRFDLEWYEAVWAVVENNSFAIDREGYDTCSNPAKAGSGLYPMASLFNHSCEPNAVWYAGRINHSRLAFNAIYAEATADIKAGEQIFIPYIPTEYPYEWRRRALAAYGFECTCPKCEREKPRGSRS